MKKLSPNKVVIRPTNWDSKDLTIKYAQRILAGIGRLVDGETLTIEINGQTQFEDVVSSFIELTDLMIDTYQVMSGFEDSQDESEISSDGYDGWLKPHDLNQED